GRWFKSSNPTEVLKLRVVFPAFPFLVVMMTAPLAALTPYSAVAAAPFRTDMDSTSAGLMSAALFDIPLAELADSMVELSMGTPSTTKRGWLSAAGSKEFTPRMMILALCPGAPPELVICTPATWPCREL